jgi:hypothetical protein
MRNRDNYITIIKLVNTLIHKYTRRTADRLLESHHMLLDYVSDYPNHIGMNQSSGGQRYSHMRFGRTRATRVTEANTVASGLIPRFCRGWAILLGRVDLRVDRQQFRNNMKI